MKAGGTPAPLPPSLPPSRCWLRAVARPLKRPGGGGEQSLCCSLIVPPWLAAQALQEHVVPGLPSHRSSDVGRPHSSLRPSRVPYLHLMFFLVLRVLLRWTFFALPFQRDRRRKAPATVGLQLYRRNCVGVFPLFNVTVSGPKEVLTERSGLFKSDFSSRCCFYYSGRGFLNPSSS